MPEAETPPEASVEAGGGGGRATAEANRCTITGIRKAGLTLGSPQEGSDALGREGVGILEERGVSVP